MFSNHFVALRIVNATHYEMTDPRDWFKEGKLADGHSWPQRIGPGETRDILGATDNIPILGCSFYVEYTLNHERLTIAASNPGGGENRAAVGLGGKALWDDGARMNSHGYHPHREPFELGGKQFLAEWTCTGGETNTVVVTITEGEPLLATSWLADDAFRYWEVNIDEAGNLAPAYQAADLSAGVTAAQLTDLFVVVHGMGNTPSEARSIYGHYFRTMRGVADEQKIDRSRIGVCGIIWPSGGSVFEQLREFTGSMVSAGGGIYDRAEQVGKRGVAAVLNELAKLANLRVHVVAHSMGTVAAAYSLQSITTPVESMFLIQGALWSRAFDDDGDLKNLKNRVKGYIVATTSEDEGRVSWLPKDRLGKQGFTPAYKATIAVRDVSRATLCGKKFIDFNCDGVIGGHDDYRKAEVARAHWAMLPI